MINQTFSIENVAVGGVDHEQYLLIVIGSFAADDFEFNSKFGGLNILIKTGPNHIARRGHFWWRTELTESLTTDGAKIDGGWINVHTFKTRFHIADVAQRSAAKNHWEIVFVADQAPAVGLEHGNAFGVLAEIRDGEFGVLSIIVRDKWQSVPAIFSWTNFFKL